jgi:uncharacterized protein YndB with AHSA1/START domain
LTFAANGVIIVSTSDKEVQMSIHESVDIARPPQEVWAYATDPTRLKEWQESLVEAKEQTEGPTRVGSRMTQTRRVGKSTRTFTLEVIAHEPPNRFAFKGIDGPVRPRGTIALEPLDDGQRTRYSMEFDVEGHGLGILLAPLVRRNIRKELPENLKHLKGKLESS